MTKLFKGTLGAATLLTMLSTSVALAAAPAAPAAPQAASTTSAQCGDPTVEAPKVADKYFAAFNAGDFVANASTMNFPSYMIAPNGDFFTFPDLKSYVEMLEGFKAYWHHEHVDEKKIVQFSPTKAHMGITVSRYDKNNVLLTTHQSMWIVTCKDGRWGIKARSHRG